jgi:hypothetical protein
MAHKKAKPPQNFVKSEIGTIRKSNTARIRIALVYPNEYHIGMSNLGFQATYSLFNQIDDLACERAFLPHDIKRKRVHLQTLESGKSLRDFDIIAFSVSFENDYPNILTALHYSGLPLRTSDRKAPLPLVIAGGVTCFLNPEPIAAFIDCFLIGEAEGSSRLRGVCLDVTRVREPDEGNV